MAGDPKTQDLVGDAIWTAAEELRRDYPTSNLRIEGKRRWSLTAWSITEGIAAYDKRTRVWEPVRSRKFFARTWKEIQPVEEAASNVGEFLRKRPELEPTIEAHNNTSPAEHGLPSTRNVRRWTRRRSPVAYPGVALLLTAAAITLYLFAFFGLALLTGPHAPDRPNWSTSQEAFEALTKTMPTAPAQGAEWVAFDIPARVGDYDMQTTAYRVHSGAIFYDTTGTGLLDDAGIAYLPDGPDTPLETGWFEIPNYKHLGGPWYSWGASW